MARNPKKARTLAILLLLWQAALAQVSGPSLAAGLSLLEEGRSSLDQKTLVKARDNFSQLISRDRNRADYFYLLARVDAYRADAYRRQLDNREAEATLQQAISEVERALALDDESAKSHSLLADLYGRRISLGGFMAGARYGPKSDAENRRAAQLDPGDAVVLASRGRQYLNAPAMFGGDVGKAIDQLLRATQADPASDENFVWLSLAYRKAGRPREAEQARAEALRLNPRSVLAQSGSSGW